MKVRKHTPLIDMSEAEREGAFDEIGMGLDFAILQEARSGKNDVLTLAVARLRSSDGSEHTAFCALEFGDGEGISQIDAFITGINRVGLLLPNEELRRELVTLPTGTLSKLRDFRRSG